LSSSTISTAERTSIILREWRTLALLGGPILVAQLAQMANGVIDTVMAGHASAQDLAGVGIGTSIWIPLLLFFVGTLNALQPTISGLRGAGRPKEIMPLAWQGIYIAAVAAVLMIVLLRSVHPLLALLNADAGTARVAEGYLRGFAWGVPALLLLNALRGLTDGLGHTRVIMMFSLLSTLLNLPLNYVFIYGKFGLPALGGIGCGWATSLANGLAVLALLIYLNRSPLFARFHLLTHWAPPIWREIRQLLRLGLPIGFTIFVEVSMFSAIALFLAPLGAKVVAGHQIVLNMISVLFMVPLSLGMALTLRVSFLVGAKQTIQARLLARSALLLASAIALVCIPLLLLGRQWLPRLYTGDLEVQAITTQLLVFAAIFQWADVLQVTAINALRGYKDTRIPMLIMLLSFWAICMPLGYALTFTDWLNEPMGAQGFWLGLILGLVLASVLLTWRLFRISGRDPSR
jgi:MATE family multidrug resistance protein